MSREKELIKNTIVLGLGKILPKVFALVTLPIITAQLTKAEYGAYDLISTLVMLIMPIVTLQIQSAAFRFLIDCRGCREKTVNIITNIYVFTIAIAFVTVLVLIFTLPYLTITIRIWSALYFLADIMKSTTAQVVRGLGENKTYSLSAVILSFTNCIGVVLSLQLMGYGLIGLVISMCMANLSAFVYLFCKVKIFNYIEWKMFSVQKIKEMVSYSWPIIPNNLSSWVLKLSDRLVITIYLGVEANAVYAVANKIPNLLSIAQSVFVMAWYENASISVHDKDVEKYYSKMFDEVFSLCIGFTAVLIGFTPLMFHILIKGDYTEAYYQMPLLILGMFFWCMSAFQGGIYIAHKRTKSVGITTIVAAGINLGINLLLVNIIGITASSISTVLAYFALYLYRMIDVLKFQKINYKIKKQIGLLVLIVIMLLVCFLNEFWSNLINMIVGNFIFLFFNRHMLLNSIKKIIKKGN